MVKSIFWPGNPVHDGAAIIRGNQVTEVGAILPLSKRDDLPSAYGTRHRAALGLAESTDALVIAVSEERGEVVVCKGSRYQAIKQKKTLEQRLREHIGIDSQKMPIWRSEKVEIASAALLSFIFITAIWLNVSRGQDTLVNIDVPIGYMNLNPEMEIVNASVNTVSLKLSASAALMRAIRPEQLQVNLDLGNAKLGENAFLITSEDVSLPPGIELKSVTPSEIFVYLDDIVSKELPVQVDWVGQLPDDLIMVSATVQPERVKVLGGQQALESLSTIYTEKIALDNLSGEGSLKADLVLQPASLKIASNSKEKVTIRYTIQVRDQM
jgi:YbbR domain-containing protein